MKSSIKSIVIVAFLIRFVLMLVNNYVVVLPQGGGDAFRFLRLADDYYYSYHINFIEVFSSGTHFFSYYGSLMYHLLWKSPVVLGFLSVVYGTFTVYYIYKASFLLWQNKKNALTVAWFAALFPQLCLNSALFLREPIISLFAAVSAYHLIRFWKHQKVSGMVVFVVLTILGTLLHTGSLFALVGLVGAVVLIRQKSRSWIKSVFSKIVALGLVGGAMFFVLSTGYGLDKFDDDSEDLVAEIATKQGSAARGGAMYPQWMQLQGGLSDIAKVPFRFAAFLFAPLIPPMARSGGHALGLFDGLLYFLLALGVFKLRKKFLIPNKAALAVLFVLGGLVFVYSMGVSNFGTGIRHRGKVAPLLLILYFHPKIYKEYLRNSWKAFRLKQLQKNQSPSKSREKAWH